ncbi:MAG: sensor domain-containing diguanylate cyclase [Cellvibrionaceae bacterium]
MSEIVAAMDGILEDPVSAEEFLQDRLEHLKCELSEIAPFAGIVISLLDKDGEHLVFEYTQVPEKQKALDNTLKTFRLPLDNEHPMCEVYKSTRPLTISTERMSEYSESIQQRLALWNCDTMQFLPIVDGEQKSFGVVLLMREEGNFSDEEVSKLLKYIHLNACQIYHRHRYLRLESKEAELNMLLSEQEAYLAFTTQLMDLSSVDEIFHATGREFLRRYPFDFVGIFVREKDRLVSGYIDLNSDTLDEREDAIRGFFEHVDVPVESEQGAITICCEQNTIMHVPDGELLRDYPMGPNDKKAYEVLGTLRTVLHLPLRYKKQAIGVLTLLCSHRVVELSLIEKQIFEHVGEFVGNALKNAELYEKVRHQNEQIEELNSKLQQRVETLGNMATRDQLTGLYNFGYFEEQLNRRVEECRRHSVQSLALLLLDVDHFKHFNDTYGHQAGNEVLKAVGKCMAEQTRRVDIVCRYGGEEFATILPMCSQEKALECAERIRKAISALRFTFEGESVRVTVSLGVASLGKESATEFIEAADSALYRAKKAGRNQSSLAGGCPA